MTAKPEFKSELAKELALLLLLSTLWGASYTFIRVGVETIPPVSLIAARTLIAGSLLAAIIRSRGIAWPRERTVWRRFLLQAGLNSVFPFLLFAWGEQTVDAGLATILNSTSPIFDFLMTALITRHETVTASKMLGIAAGVRGTCLIIGVEALLGLGREFWAQSAIVAATVCYAGAAIAGKSFKGLDPMLPAAGSLLSGAAILVPLSLVGDRPWMLVPSLRSVLALLALAIVSTALAMVSYFRLVQTLGSIGATAQSYLRVPIGVAIGVLVLGARLSPPLWLGLACVLAGVFAMTLPARKAVAAQASWSQLIAIATLPKWAPLAMCLNASLTWSNGNTRSMTGFVPCSASASHSACRSSTEPTVTPCSRCCCITISGRRDSFAAGPASTPIKAMVPPILVARIDSFSVPTPPTSTTRSTPWPVISRTRLPQSGIAL